MTDHSGSRPATTPVDTASETLHPSAIALVFEPGPQRVLARVRGEIDMDDAGGLREDLLTALTSSRAGLDLDLSAVTFCDSSGLHVLLDLHKLATEAGKSFVLTAVSRPVAHLLQLTGIQRLLTSPTPSDGTTPTHPATAPV
ncbi:STAS domain-containing protein [Streptomyces sp. PvR034]|uniref:STAS domain-containing protein n=1 Tax=Streptomyces sp. PvR034 TaxID=3156401 RepID=UPI003398C5D7